MTTTIAEPLVQTASAPTEALEPDLRIGHLFEWAQTSAGWRLVVTDNDTARRLAPTRLSPSTAKAMHGCPTRWAVERVMPDDSDPFAPAPIGTSAHTVAESLYQLPPEERTEDRARLILLDLADEEWKGEGVEVRLNKAKWIEAVKAALWGLFKIEDPTKVDVHSTEKHLEDILIDGVPINGYVDRIDRVHADPDDLASEIVGYKVVDYKTGRERPEHDDQLRLYAKAIEVVSGKTVVEAVAYYTSTGKKRKAGLGPRLMKGTIESFHDSWAMLNDYAAKRAYPTAPSALCGWCVLAKVCPSVSEVSLSENARNHVAMQPEPESLGLGLPIVQTPTPGIGEPAQTGFADEAEHGESVPAEPVHTTPAAAHLEGESAESDTGAATIPNEERTMTENQPTLLREGKAYDEYTGDTLNPNSFAAIAVCGATAWAYEELQKAEQPISDASIDALSETFAEIILHVQHQITGRRNWQEGANTRARSFLHSYMDANPIPWGQDETTWKKWVSRAKGHCTAMFKAAIRRHESEPRAGAYAMFVPAASEEPQVDGFADPDAA